MEISLYLLFLGIREGFLDAFNNDNVIEGNFGIFVGEFGICDCEYFVRDAKLGVEFS
jgi:hypothetical protein